MEAAIEPGVTSVALTNINSTCDAWEFVKLCRDAGIKTILGVEFRNGDKFLYVLLAPNNMGVWIHEFLSAHLLEKKEFPDYPVATFFDDLYDGFVIFPLISALPSIIRAKVSNGEVFSVSPSPLSKVITLIFPVDL